MTGAPLRFLAAAVVLLAACSNDSPDSQDPVAGLTLPSQTLVFPNASGRPTSVVTSTTVAREPSPTAAPGETLPPTTAGVTISTIAAPTTTQPVAPCDMDTVIADIGPADDGYQFTDLHCASAWGTIVLRAQDPNVSTDELVVMHADDDRLWSVVAGGGDTSCTTAGIPPELFGPLACGRWETGS